MIVILNKNILKLSLIFIIELFFKSIKVLDINKKTFFFCCFILNN